MEKSRTQEIIEEHGVVEESFLVGLTSKLEETSKKTQKEGGLG